MYLIAVILASDLELAVEEIEEEPWLETEVDIEAYIAGQQGNLRKYLGCKSDPAGAILENLDETTQVLGCVECTACRPVPTMRIVCRSVKS